MPASHSSGLGSYDWRRVPQVDVYIFEAELDEFPEVSRRIAVRGDQTLADLHEELRGAFEWWDDHLYSFWLDGEFWGNKQSEYTAPLEPEPGTRTAEITLETLGLEPGREIAYVFDFGDEWRVRLTLTEMVPVDHAETYPVTLARRGKAPAQYTIPDEEELGAGD
jgi:Plasmid pRiA4b ORF-3-like protein